MRKKFLLFLGISLLFLFGAAGKIYAETGRTPQDSNLPAYCSVGQLPPGPPPSSNLIAANAVRLVEAINASCGVRVTLSNYTCTKNALVFLPNPAIAYNEIVTSVNYGSWEILQCVGFVKALLGGLNVAFKGSGDASQYAVNIPPGWQFIRRGNRMLPGDLMVRNNKDGAGHIAVVVQVSGDTTFQIAEGNGDEHGKVDLRDTDTSELGVAGGFLRKL